MKERIYKSVRAVIFFIKNDPIRKLIALAFTLLIFYLMSDVQEVTYNNVGVAFTGVPENLIITAVNHASVDEIDIKGRPDAFKAFQANQKLLIPFSSHTSQDGNVYRFTPDLKNIQLPDGLSGTKLIRRSQEPILVTVDEKVKKSVPLVPRFKDENVLLSKGFKIGQVRFPGGAEITVIGPKRMLEDMNEIQTEDISVAETPRSFERKIKLKKQAAGGNVTYLVDDAGVDVSVTIDKSMEKKVFEHIPVRILCPPEMDARFSMSLSSNSTVTITVEGDKNALDKVDTKDLNPYIDVSQFDKQGVYNVEVKCWLASQGVRIINVHPSMVTVKFDDRPPPAK